MSDIPGNPKVSRKLAAILAADIAGYSALMGADDEATVRDLKAHQAVILPLVGEHGGRIIDTAGDGILAEFASVVNAVECAVAIQKTMAERNAGTDPERRMKFRIGINLGDVIHDEQRVYGDGVNIAARLEAMGEPGGICLSGEAFWLVQRRQLKNIAQPVRLYRVGLSISRPRTSGQDPPSPCPTDRQSRSYPSPTSAAIRRKTTSAMALPKTSSRSSLASQSYSSSLAIRASSTRASLPISAKLAVSSVSATSLKGVSAVPATVSAFPAS